MFKFIGGFLKGWKEYDTDTKTTKTNEEIKTDEEDKKHVSQQDIIDDIERLESRSINTMSGLELKKELDLTSGVIRDLEQQILHLNHYRKIIVSEIMEREENDNRN